MRVVAIITARWYSMRFEGKALADLGGKPILQHIVDNARNCEGVAEVVVATSMSSTPIINYCKQNDIKCYVGSEEDVLDRLTKAAQFYEADVVLRLWGDNPLDPYVYFVQIKDLEKANEQASQEERDKWNNVSEKDLFTARWIIPSQDLSVNTPEDLERVRKKYEESQGNI
jgi:spore coat polysaccharide biosynthesis protein SpsF (cytidylyltransferase family)